MAEQIPSIGQADPTTDESWQLEAEEWLEAMDDVLDQAAAWRKQGRSVALATVVSTWGSAPCPAGSLLVLKVFLGFSVHELFFALTAMIGIGLIVAGTTRWCGMARLIARMPWNRNTNCTQAASA